MARTCRVPLIGREDALAILEAELATAIEGEPRAVAFSGEAGIGKSRLLAEATRLAAAAGALTLTGRCVDERGMPPYLPWFDAFSGASDRHPDLDQLRITLTVEQDGQTATSLSPEGRKLRLYDGVTRALASLAGKRPLVLAFDDLQWSDAASYELLRYLLVHLPAVPLLVVGTYRAEEAGGNAELTRTIDELRRRRLLTVVPVGPLGPDETARLVAALLGGEASDLAMAIHAHSEGNPFFVEEVVRALAEDGRLPRMVRLPATALPSSEAGGKPSAPALATLSLPPGVMAVIERRLARLSAACRGTLEVAALAGRAIEVDVVALAAELDLDVVASHLEEAARAALVRPVPGAVARDSAAVADFEFLHDRVREAIAAGINPVRRRQIHGRLLAAIEAMGAVENLERLATLTHHARLARQPVQAAVYATRLGDAAMRAHAHAEAARAYRIAVESVPDTAPPEKLPPRAELLLRLGDAALAAGDADAIPALTAAEAAFVADGDRRGIARARRRLGTAHARREAFDVAVAYLEAALTSLAELERKGGNEAIDVERAEVLIEFANIHGTSLARYDDASAAGRAALDLATHLPGGSPGIEAQARLSLAKTLIRAGRLDEGYDLLAPAMALALAAGDPNLAAEVAGTLANHAYWVGDLDASAQAALRRRALAIEGGDPYALRHADAWLALVALARGDWTEADMRLREAEAQVARIESPEPRAFLRQLGGLLCFQQGRYAEAVPLLEEAVAGFRRSGPGTLIWYLGCLAPAYLAAAEAAELVETFPAGAVPRGPILNELGIYAVATGGRSDAARRYEQLRAYAGQHHWVLVDRVLGMLAALLGDLEAAERHFADATRTATRHGIRPELALTLAERGLALRRAADAALQAAAEPLLREALDRLRDLEMAGEAARIAAILDEAPKPRPIPNPAGLSDREIEVLRLVAQGLTNREIGHRLFISEKTVTNHLTHIFTKANLGNRAAAVAFAHRHGLI